MKRFANWKYRIRWFAVLVMACVTSIALAGDLTVTWVNATQDTTGVALPTDGSAQALKSTLVSWGVCNADGTFPSVADTVTVLMPAVTTKILALADGKWCVRARHQNNALVLSNWSATASKVLATVVVKPKPPSAVAVP